MDNSLKKSFPIYLKEENDGGDDCGCGSDSASLSEAFDQESGATSFLQEQSNPFTEEEDEDEVPEEFEDEQEEDEEEMEESRGAVEDVLADINGYSNTEDDGMDDVVAQTLNRINEDDEKINLPFEDQGEPDSTMSHDGEDDRGELPDAERKDEIDEVLADVLDEDTVSEDEEDPCWEGYEMVGTKTQDGEEVPNCVPEEDVEDYEPQEESVESVGGVDILDAVLEDQVDELSKLDRLAEEVLDSGSKQKVNEVDGIETASELRFKLDSMPEMEKYHNAGARYDDVHYEIPLDVMKSKLGLNRSDLERIDKKSDREYAGSILFNGNTVEVLGAA